MPHGPIGPRLAAQPIGPPGGKARSLLHDAEVQLDKFNAVFKELCRRLTCSQEELASQQTGADASLDGIPHALPSWEIPHSSSSGNYEASEARGSTGSTGSTSSILQRGHLNDPNPEDEEEEGRQPAAVTNSDATALAYPLPFSSNMSIKRFASVQSACEVLQAPASSSASDDSSAIAKKSTLLKKKTTIALSNLPETFEINDVWHASLHADEEQYISESRDIGHAVKGVTSMESDGHRQKRSSSRSLLLPNQPVRALWDLLGVFFMMLDLVWIPLLMCGAPDTEASKILSWNLRVYWTFDIPATFMTGFVDEDGETVMDSRRVAIRYFKTWFFLDLLLVLIDWIEMVLTEAHGMLRSARFGKLMRMARVIRMVRLVRLAKLPGIMKRILDNIFAERTLMIMSITQITSVFVGFCHIIACIWFKLGADSYDGENWLEQFGFGEDITEHSYLVSLHWAVTSFIGNAEIGAVNIRERIFSVVVLFVSFVASASFVSAITTSITRVQIIHGEEQTHFSMLRTFLQAQGINAKLAVRITKNAKYAVKFQKHKVHEKDVELLALISSSLMLEMHYDMYSRVLRKHVLFKFYCALNPVAIQRICHLGILIETFTNQELLFRVGKRPDPPSMLFLIQGTLKYLIHSSEKKINLDPARFVCEATLWLSSWVHRGRLIADEDSTLMRLLAEPFQQIMCEEFPPTHADHPAWYGLWFLQSMRDLEPHLITDLDCEWDQTCLIERHQQFESEQAEARRQNFKESMQRSWSSFRDRESSTVSTAAPRPTGNRGSLLAFRQAVSGFSKRPSSDASGLSKARPKSIRMIMIDPESEVTGHGSIASRSELQSPEQ